MRRWVTALMLAFPPASAARAQDQYRGLPFPPDEIYEAMLGYADSGGFQGLTASLRYVHPLSTTLRESFQEDPEAGIRAAAVRGSPAEAREAVLRLIFLDLRYNLAAAAAEEDAAKRAQQVRLAALDYSFLSPRLRAADRAVDRAAQELLRRLLRDPQRRRTKELSETLLALLGPSFLIRGVHETR